MLSPRGFPTSLGRDPVREGKWGNLPLLPRVILLKENWVHQGTDLAVPTQTGVGDVASRWPVPLLHTAPFLKR